LQRSVRRALNTHVLDNGRKRLHAKHRLLSHHATSSVAKPREAAIRGVVAGEHSCSARGRHDPSNIAPNRRLTVFIPQYRMILNPTFRCYGAWQACAEWCFVYVLGCMPPIARIHSHEDYMFYNVPHEWLLTPDDPADVERSGQDCILSKEPTPSQHATAAGPTDWSESSQC